ncbi:fungal-specific transcription factor domain-containing protein [Sparassis latifolia]
MDQEQPAQQPQLQQDDPSDQSKPTGKAPVVRGARACTVCRQAKMKCVGADDANNIPCQRCKRAGLDCIFEKHRRGRKPGSRLSEASKMLRRLEKGLNNAKQKSTKDSVSLPSIAGASADGRFHLDLEGSPRDGQESESDVDEDDEDAGRTEGGMYPARLIKKENQRHSFFKTILNPEVEPARPGGSDRSYSQANTQSPPANSRLANESSPFYNSNPPLKDPIAAGMIDDKTAHDLFDMFFIRLNQFINLFDPALHSVEYVRSRCPFLFTAIIMGACKFFKPELYMPMLRLAHEFAVRAFAENWKRVEVVQAFACMTYWREPEDTRTWTYIGYACRMSVELGLNRYVGKRTTYESDYEMRERRNKERTYLVLFVHDRSLCMQTGKQWMLPECNLVKHAGTWHEEGGSQIRPEDVILAAFVHLRRIAGEIIDIFQMRQSVPGSHQGDTETDMHLKTLNSKLDQWVQHWQNEMQRAHGETFHFSFLRCFQQYVRVFLNSFGVNTSPTPPSSAFSDVRALNTCYASAMDNLQAVAKDFASMSVLRYGQDSITVMTAYSAIFLLKLLRSANRLEELKDNAQDEIYGMITKTADAYQEAAALSPASSSAAYHSRFLRSLVTNDTYKQRQLQQAEQEKHKQGLPPPGHRPQASFGPAAQPTQNYSPVQMYPPVTVPLSVPVDRHPQMDRHPQNYHYSPSPNVPTPPLVGQGPSPASSTSIPSQPYSYAREPEYASTSPESAGRSGAPSNYGYSGPSVPPSTAYAQHPAQPTSFSELVYWHQMFREAGMSDGADSAYMAGYPSYGVNDGSAPVSMASGYAPSTPSYREPHHGYAHPQYQQYPMMNGYPAPTTFNGR